MEQLAFFLVSPNLFSETSGKCRFLNDDTFVYKLKCEDVTLLLFCPFALSLFAHFKSGLCSFLNLLDLKMYIYLFIKNTLIKRATRKNDERESLSSFFLKETTANDKRESLSSFFGFSCESLVFCHIRAIRSCCSLQKKRKEQFAV